MKHTLKSNLKQNIKNPPKIRNEMSNISQVYISRSDYLKNCTIFCWISFLWNVKYILGLHRSDYLKIFTTFSWISFELKNEMSNMSNVYTGLISLKIFTIFCWISFLGCGCVSHIDVCRIWITLEKKATKATRAK